MIPTTFTLEELAHFERCLFREDWERGLREAGFPEDEIQYFVSHLKRRDGKMRHFMEMYQEYISDPAFTAAITRMAGLHVAHMRAKQNPCQ